MLAERKENDGMERGGESAFLLVMLLTIGNDGRYNNTVFGENGMKERKRWILC